MNYWTLNNKTDVYVAAHRGWKTKYPENTLPAFDAAALAGVDQIETDVRVTRDGELVLIHDETLDRTTGGTGLVRDHTLSELKKIDASNGMDGFSGVRIPTLEEFLSLMKERNVKTLDIELKEYPENGREETAFKVCDKTVALIDRYGYLDRGVLNTFSLPLHEYIRNAFGDSIRRHVYWPLSALRGAAGRDPYEGAFCCCMFGDECGGAMASRSDFASMRARGVSPWAGAGVKTFEQTEKAVEYGADLITTNDPGETLSFLRRLGRHA